jgi:hypothetical protein
LHSVNSRRLLSFAGEGLTGFEFGQVNVLYDRIKIGPQSFVSRVMDTVNLDRVEFLKGPSSLMSGDGAIGGAVPPEETAASRPPPPDVDARKRLTSRIAVGRLFAAARKSAIGPTLTTCALQQVVSYPG